MTTAVQGRRSRRTELRRRRRQRRNRVAGAFAAVLALLAAAFGVYLAQDDPARPDRAGAQERTQRTLLLQLTSPGGGVVGSALVAQDPEAGTGAAVLVPPQVLVNVPGTGQLPFGRALRSSSPQGSQDALSDLMGVTVDDGWVLPLPLLTRLVDVLGGIEVDADVAVVRDRTVVLDAGPQRVDGARAVALLSYLAAGEQEQARLARLQQVLDGLVSALPETPAELAPVLQGLGAGSVSTLPPPGLAALLVGLAEADDDGRLQYDSLPVIPIDPGGGVTAFRIDAERLLPVVDRLLADSVPAGVREGGNRVLVLNGVGTPGLGEAVRAKLAPAGFVFVGARNAPAFGYPTTQVLVPTATAEAQALGERVAKAIGVPPTSVAAQEFGTVADVVVLVGADFRP